MWRRDQDTTSNLNYGVDEQKILFDAVGLVAAGHYDISNIVLCCI